MYIVFVGPPMVYTITSAKTTFIYNTINIVAVVFSQNLAVRLSHVQWLMASIHVSKDVVQN